METSEALTAIAVMLGAWLFWPLLLALVIISGFVLVTIGIMLYSFAVDAWTLLRKKFRR